jgi:hypothetical protein
MRKVALACGLGVTLATSGCLGGGGGDSKSGRKGGGAGNRAPQISGAAPPAARDVGLYTGITIVASDGRSSTALPEFELAVTQTASGIVTLSWLPPTQNDDGSSLKDLAGYRIYVGQDPAARARVIVLNNAGLTRYVVDNLSPATWHFAMTSFNRKGQESSRSATVSKEVG